MPQVLAPDGQTYVVPGVYTSIQAALNGAGPLPEFQVPVLIADSYAGYPSNFTTNTGRLDSELNLLPFLDIGNTTTCQEIFGAASDLSVIYANAKRNGLPRAWCIGAGQMVRAKIVVRSTGPVAQFDIVGYYWGFLANWTKIRFTSGGIFGYQVPQKISKITTNVTTGDTRIYVDDNSWAVPGMAIEIGDNNTANSAAVVYAKGVELSTTGQPRYWIRLVAAASDAYATADYAAIALYGSGVSVSPVFSSGQGQDLIDWINSTRVLKAQRIAASFTGALPIAIASLTALKDISTWGTMTPGTAPASSASTYTDFVSAMNDGLWERFITQARVFPRAWYVGSSASDTHAVWRDYALQERAASRGYPISVTTGCAWGDTDLSASNSTNPVYRSGLLNSQDIDLGASGADGQAAYLTLAAAAWGRLCSGGLPHNLTNDPLEGFTTFEATWNEAGLGELTELCRGGVFTYINRFLRGAVTPVISQGLSTLQANTQLWFNLGSEGYTWSRQQRDLADFVDRNIKIDFMNQVIGLEVDVNIVRTTLVTRGQQLITRGILVSFRVISVTRNIEANGWDFLWNAELPGLTDYVTGTTTILFS